MNREIHCTLHNHPETLERVLQVIRIRGFQLQHLEAQQQNRKLLLNLSVTSERPLDNLVQQLRKLVDMCSLQVLA